jgi:dihydropyrimidinase
MGAMVDAGVTTFKVFLAYRGVLMVTDDQFLRVLQESKATGGLVMVHAENGYAIDLLVNQALAAGRTEPKVHAETRPEIFEAEATSRAVRMAEYAGTPIYIVHVSCRSAAEEIIAGRARGVDALGETCVQYLTLEVDDLSRPGLDGFEGARYVCSPPLRDPANQPFLWDAIADDHLQVLSTDHCPFNDEQKRLGVGDFSKIPNGLALIQHRVNLLWEHGVREGKLSGKDADVAIFDPDREHVFSRETSLMAVDYDLFEGRRTHGSVRTTLVRGTTVWDDGRILTRPGHGRFVARATYGGA